ncbi:maleylpyruvate isomerase family mycothiol-dependent enzyme [Amycolatopsis rhabdoformis]|uniref:Maleylpyruvate isomerase family mycothiol-dependent enzyme n=1 Tax=Amycolatopsis rhabdoformis TaxID=1448059 RepID=A0ABZ1IL14_9PSEU|nr:maleylpyruvate isomerase family mycothiol-dependent enzyme [Amycolatopsis rhabdoformis]WSE34918.1 maleylpyruvate isomerase family mycothiol-dependent enzyme [Amycolatopsis rhabdoformis]
MTPEDHVTYLRALTTQFAEAVRAGEAGEPVPDCAGWTRADLVTHLGGIHRWAAEIVRTGEPQQPADEPAPEDLAAWYAESAALLLAELEAADPADRCWHFGGTPKTKAFWFRRQTHETAVHLLDLHGCAGTTLVLDPLVAADGVDEVFSAMLPRITRWHAAPPLAAPLTLRATDTGHEWTVVPGEPPALGEGEPAATVEASAQELLTLLWKRGAVEPRITGDEELARGFLKAPLTP